MTFASSTAQRSIFARATFGVVVAFLLGYLFLNAGARGVLVDDTFITFQYARNLAEHGRLTWHIELPTVDGYTSLGHVLLLAAGLALGLDVVLANSIIVFTAMAALAFAWLRYTRDYRPGPRLLGFSIICVSSGYAFWIAGGLDAIPYAAAFFVTYQSFEKAERTGQFGWAAGLSISCLALMRPEGMFIAIALLSYFWLGRANGRIPASKRAARWSVALIILLTAFLTWRISVYGYPFPNTFYAKASASRWLEIQTGFEYFENWVGHFGGAIVLVSGLTILAGSRHVTRFLFVLGGAALAIVSGGDPHPEMRFFLPLLPLIALDICWLAAHERTKLQIIAPLFAMLFYVFQFPSFLGYRPSLGANIVGNWPPASPPLTYAIARVLGGRWPMDTVRDDPLNSLRSQVATDFSRVIKPDLKVAATDVGVLAYYSKLPILDVMGLNHAGLAHLPNNDGVANIWGRFDLKYFLDEKVPVIYPWFPRVENSTWNDVSYGRANCDGHSVRRAQIIGGALPTLTAGYKCVSIPSDKFKGDWHNFIVRTDRIDDVLIDPVSAQTSACFSKFRRACGFTE